MGPGGHGRDRGRGGRAGIGAPHHHILTGSGLPPLPYLAAAVAAALAGVWMGERVCVWMWVCVCVWVGGCVCVCACVCVCV